MSAPVGSQLAVRCDVSGVVLEVLRAPVAIEPGRLLATALSGRDLPTLLDLLDGARARGVAFASRPVVLEGRGRTLQTVSLRLRDGALLAAGAETVGAVRALLADPRVIGDGEVEALRSALRGLPGGPRGARVDEALELTTEALALQRETARQAAELERVNRTLRELFGMASHDLRSPLAALVVLAPLLEEGLSGQVAEADLELVGELGALGSNMAALVEDLLDVAKAEAGRLVLRPEPVDVVEVLGAMVRRSTRLSARRQVGIHLESAGSVRAVVDPARIGQAVENLLANAVKFTPDGGKVFVHVARCGRDLRVRVSDEGPGIDPLEREKLFEPFAQGAAGLASGHGAGLGLAIAQRLAAAHGGRVDMETSPQGGATFELVVPVEPPSRLTPPSGAERPR